MIVSSSTSAGSTARVTGSAGCGSVPPGDTVPGSRSSTARARSRRPPAAIESVRSSSRKPPEADRCGRSTSGHIQATAVRAAGTTGCSTT